MVAEMWAEADQFSVFDCPAMTTTILLCWIQTTVITGNHASSYSSSLILNILKYKLDLGTTFENCSGETSYKFGDSSYINIFIIVFVFAVVMSSSPNIILILADDLGWNEVSWHNPFFLTPNLEVELSRVFLQPPCRSEIFTLEIFPGRSSPDSVLHHSQMLSEPGCPDDWEISLEDWDAARSDREIPTRRTKHFHQNITSVSPASGIQNSRGNLVLHIFYCRSSKLSSLFIKLWIFRFYYFSLAKLLLFIH